MKTINVAIVGAAGWIGSVHSECYLRLRSLLPDVQVRLHTAVDVARENVKKTAEQYGFAHYSLDYGEAVDNPEIDIVDICCSNNFHKDIAIRAARAGKSVMCEKPLTLSLEDAEEMVKAVRDGGNINVCNLIHRKYPGVVFIRNLIEQGSLGRLYYMRATIEQDSHADPMDMHAWLFNRTKAGGGSIVTNGTHVIDLCRFIMGDFDRVVAHSETFIKRRPRFSEDQIGKAGSRTFIEARPDALPGEMIDVDVDDATGAIVCFKNGGFGMIISSWAKQGVRHNVGFEVVGSKGTASFNTERINEVQLYENKGGSRDRIGFTTIILGNEHPYGALNNMKTGHGIGGKDVFTIMTKEFVEAVVNRQPMKPDFEDGLINIRYLKRIQQSADEGRWVAAD